MNPLGSSNYDREPIKAPGFMDDYLCGLSAATATLSAIFSRSITGEGQHIDISKQQALINLDRVEFDHYPNQGKIAHRVPTEVYEGGLSYIKCKDGYVVAVAMNDRQWESIVNMMGQPEWAKDERFASMESRIEHSEVLQTLMGEELLNFTKEEIYHGGQIGGGMVGMVCSIDEVVNSKQLSTRGFFVDIDHPEAGRLKYPSASYQFSKTPWRVRMAAPLLGEHNEEIYINRLGYSDDEFVKLRMGGVI